MVADYLLLAVWAWVFEVTGGVVWHLYEFRLGGEWRGGAEKGGEWVREEAGDFGCVEDGLGE